MPNFRRNRAQNQPVCGHEAAGPLGNHSTGIAAHVAIYLEGGIGVWDAYQKIREIQSPPGGGAATVGDLHVEKIHVALGEIDLLADVHAPWGGGGMVPDGFETARIGEWVSEVRRLTAPGGRPYVKRTSTAVCMGVDF